MRYYTDPALGLVTDHGLGAHGLGQYSVINYQQPAPACPPPGFPGHTQDNGASCCIPSGCVRTETGYLAAKIQCSATSPASSGGGTFSLSKCRSTETADACCSRLLNEPAEGTIRK